MSSFDMPRNDESYTASPLTIEHCHENDIVKRTLK